MDEGGTVIKLICCYGYWDYDKKLGGWTDYVENTPGNLQLHRGA